MNIDGSDETVLNYENETFGLGNTTYFSFNRNDLNFEINPPGNGSEALRTIVIFNTNTGEKRIESINR